MEIKKFDSIDAVFWDEAVLKSKNGVFIFHRNYMDYHKEKFKDHSLMILKNNKIIAQFPATEHGSQIVSHGGLTFGSLIMSFDVKAVEILEVLNQVKYYSRLYNLVDRLKLVIMPERNRQGAGRFRAYICVMMMKYCVCWMEMIGYTMKIL